MPWSWQGIKPLTNQDSDGRYGRKDATSSSEYHKLCKLLAIMPWYLQCCMPFVCVVFPGALSFILSQRSFAFVCNSTCAPTTINKVRERVYKSLPRSYLPQKQSFPIKTLLCLDGCDKRDNLSKPAWISLHGIQWNSLKPKELCFCIGAFKVLNYFLYGYTERIPPLYAAVSGKQTQN